MHATIIDRGALPSSVLEFATKQRLLAPLQTALDLVETHFRPLRRVTAEIETDPETVEQRIVIDLTVEAGVPDVLTMNEAFTQHWVAATSADARSHIRVLYDIA